MKGSRLIVLTAALSFTALACGPSYSDRSRAPASSARSQAADTEFISAENIQEMQRVLRDQGYDPGRVDGTMDDQTRQALRRFQDVRNIPQTGRLDRDTVGQLEKAGAHFTGQLGALRQDERDRRDPSPYIP